MNRRRAATADRPVPRRSSEAGSGTGEAADLEKERLSTAGTDPEIENETMSAVDRLKPRKAPALTPPGVEMGAFCVTLKDSSRLLLTPKTERHSYMVYAPLLIGCTTIAFEGALDYPDAGANWRTAVEELGVTGIFTSPTAVRMLMRYGNEPLLSIDHTRLERVVCAGEVLNPPAWDWLQNTILGGHVPVIDHMWQTETSGPVFGNPYGLGLLPIKPGSARTTPRIVRREQCSARRDIAPGAHRL
jgi:AMP-binding enzyme